MMATPRRLRNSSAVSKTRAAASSINSGSGILRPARPKCTPGRLRCRRQDLRAEPPPDGAPDAGPAREEADAHPARTRAGRQGQRQTLRLTLEGEKRDGPEDRVLELCTRNSASSSQVSRKSRCYPSAADFSAPVVIRGPESAATRAFLMSHDADSFNRWEAGQKLSTGSARRHGPRHSARPAPQADSIYIEAVGGVIARAAKIMPSRP